MLLPLLIGGILAGAVGVDCQEVQQKSHVSRTSTLNGSAIDSVTCLCLVIFENIVVMIKALLLPSVLLDYRKTRFKKSGWLPVNENIYRCFNLPVYGISKQFSRDLCRLMCKEFIELQRMREVTPTLLLVSL